MLLRPMHPLLSTRLIMRRAVGASLPDCKLSTRILFCVVYIPVLFCVEYNCVEYNPPSINVTPTNGTSPPKTWPPARLHRRSRWALRPIFRRKPHPYPRTKSSPQKYPPMRYHDTFFGDEIIFCRFCLHFSDYFLAIALLGWYKFSGK